jgi:hypothetical protein
LGSEGILIGGIGAGVRDLIGCGSDATVTALADSGAGVRDFIG